MKPHFRAPVILFILAIIAWTVSLQFPIGSNWMWAGSAIAGVLAVFGLLTGLDWLMARVALRQRDFQSIRTADAVRLLRAKQDYLEKFLQLSEAQIEAMGDYQVTIEHIPTTGESPPVHYVVVGSRKISFEFIDEFLANSDEHKLAPVSTWPDKTRKHLDADLLTKLWMANGLAYRRTDTSQAEWYSPEDYHKGLRIIGYEIPTEGKT